MGYSESRRDFLKTSAVTATACAAGLAAPGINPAASQDADGIRWDKAVCRFCGTGCSVLLGVKDGRVVASQGDPDAPVNKGLNCIKGYFLTKIMYGKDRLTKPLLRKTDGKYDKNGQFEEVTWDEAFTVMAEHWKKALKEKGTSAVGMFGSGQWTIWEGYAASKLMKAGFRTNNLEPNARHCMASAVGAFMRAFGIDEPAGCYDDLEHADAFVLWGANMAEMHPILWSRLTNTRLTKPGCEVHVLSTFENRNFELADNGMVFEPQTDLAIANYIANYIIQNKAYNKEFVDKHVNFTKTPTDIGYGLRPEDPREQAAKNAGKGKLTKISFEEYAKSVEPYTLDYVSKLSKVPAAQLEKLAKAYADPEKKVASYWTMGFNQHTRGVWVNGLVYNIHLLMGKIAEPGNSPFSLTGQPSACGTAREVGTFAHRLPADLVVKKEAHRKFAEKVWQAAGRHDQPQGRVPRRPDAPQDEGRGDELLLAAVQQQPPGLRQHERGRRARLAQSGQFRHRFRSLSDGLGPGRGPDPADRHVGGEGRGLRQRRTAHPVLAPAGQGAGRVAVRHVADHRVLQIFQGRGGLAGRSHRQEAGIPGQDAL